MQTTSTDPHGVTAGLGERAGKYLTFRLGSEEFGVRVDKVREIMGVQEITSVPQTPEYLRGVINLRGKVIPVIDLRLKFGLPSVPDTQRTCIVVVQVRGELVDIQVGIVVDAVSEVLNLASADCENTPDLGPHFATPFIVGMARVKNKVKILLDIDRVISATEMSGFGSLLPTD